MSETVLAERPTETQPKVRFQAETLAMCRFGIEALMEDHGQEFTYHKDVKGEADPDWDLAYSVEREGRLRILTARDGHDRLVGYFVYSLPQSAHYRRLKQAWEDTFYMAPAFRGWTLYKFIKFAVQHMEQSGAPVLVVTSKVKADLAPIWKRLGFEPEEIRYTKAVVPKKDDRT